MWTWVTFLPGASSRSSVARGGELARWSQKPAVDAEAGAGPRKEGARIMALWGRLGGNSDKHPDGNIGYGLFSAVLELWITGAAGGGLTNAEALAALIDQSGNTLSAAEQTEITRLKTAMNSLASDAERRVAAAHTIAVMALHEQDRPPIQTGAELEQSLADWFAAKGVTF